MKSVSTKELRAIWRGLGIRVGQSVLCHSSLVALGRLRDGPESLVKSILSELKPDGTLVAPAFTYSYFRDEVYDPAETPSTVGVLAEIMRRMPGAVRSKDPNFSNVAIGPAAERLMAWEGGASLGHGSFYDRFIEADGRVLLLGVGFEALPIFMHLERLLNVPYRYDKRFAGRTKIGDAIINTVAVHAVRDERLEPKTDRGPIGEIIAKESAFRSVPLHYGTASFVPARTIAAVVERELAKNPNILLDREQPFERALP